MLLAYLFGSTAQNAVGPMSDIDIAVLFNPKTHRSSAYGRLMDDLCLALRTNHLDLVDLDRAPYPLRYRILKKHVLLCCRDEKVREHFESDSIRRYLDFKPIREAAFRVARQRVLEES